MFSSATLRVQAVLSYGWRLSASNYDSNGYVNRSTVFRMQSKTRGSFSKGKDQPGKVASPALGKVNRENEYFPVLVCA